MVERIQLLRNVGLFDSISPGAQLPFDRFNVVYAENGRGKTTLAAILRSLGNGDVELISERRRLGAQNDPHIIIVANGINHTFQANAWSAPLPSIAVFDDHFVAQNVCSGVEIEAGHRQNLHELILGAQGVALNTVLQGHVAAIEEHNRQLRLKEAAIPAATRGALTLDAFCALAEDPNLADAIRETERGLTAARSAAAIQARHAFVTVDLPGFDIAALNVLLGRSLADLDTAAAEEVQRHVAKLGADAERWIAEGLAYVDRVGDDACPFCAQHLPGSSMLAHYRSYFAAAYDRLKADIAAELEALEAEHGEDRPAAFERNVRLAGESRSFWAQFMELPAFDADTAPIAIRWRAAKDQVATALREKQASPLERRVLAQEALDAIGAYEELRGVFSASIAGLVGSNDAIALIKEQSQAAAVDALAADLVRLRLTEVRHGAAVAPLCTAYLAEKAGKTATEALRTQARTALDNYRQNVFPAYEAAINVYLQRFGAGFRIQGVAAVNNRGGSSATYSMVINNVAVQADAAGGPAFKNTLSAGDRNTLALAFFFASLDVDPQKAQKIVVIDDPMTSLDEHRSLMTVQEVRRLLPQVSQLIVLSHSKQFLWELWDATTVPNRRAMRLARGIAATSELVAWDITQDALTEHDNRRARALSYLQQADLAQERTVATDIRPTLEAFIRVAYAEAFPAGSLLGPFLNSCQGRVGTANELLSAADMVELRDLLDYANRFHHDTNPAWQTAAINDQELATFVRRSLRFTRRN